MEHLNDLMMLLMLGAAWVQTPEGSNLIFALICAAVLAGVPGKLCLWVTLLVHLALVLL